MVKKKATPKPAPSAKKPASGDAKKETAAKGTAKSASGSGKAPAKRKTSRHVKAWAELSVDAREEFFANTPAAKVLDAIDSSYAGDVVNTLLDLRKARVRQILERLSSTRKRSMADVVTLYYYKAYLTDPYPMAVGNNNTPNYYAILGVSREAADEDIKTAHRLLARAHRPETFPPAMRKTAEERLGEISDAFQHLNTDERRRETDTILPSMHYLYPRRDQSWLDAAQKVLESRS